MTAGKRICGVIGIAGLVWLAAEGAAWAGALTGVSAIGTGNNHTLVVMADGTVMACGQNDYGQIGDGTSGNARYALVETVGLSGVTNIAGGGSHTVALKSDGTVRTWGQNWYGQLGDNSGTDRSSPVAVSGLTGAVAVDAGSSHSVALKSNGSVWAWGNNSAGQLGDGTTTTRWTPVQVSGFSSGVAAIAAGSSHTVALKSDGSVWAWGYNMYGQLGNGTNTASSVPVQVSGLSSGVTAIAAGGSHNVALKSDGTLWAWGYNSSGQLGDGTSIMRRTPVQVSGLTNGVTTIAAGGNHTMALKADGTVWVWGNNSWFQLGDGTSTSRLTPVQISGLTGASAIDGGGYHTLALKSDSTAWVWGYNVYGQLGNGTTTITNRPTQMQIVGNNPPIAYTFRDFCLPNGSVTSAPAYYDVDAGGTWTAVVVSNAAHGTVTGGANLIYTPNSGFTGEDSFKYLVNDGETNSNVATGRVMVRAHGDPAGMLVDIVVNATLYTALSNEVQRLRSDLTNEGYTAIITPLASGTSAQALWTHLNSVYQANPLVGALLVGNVAKYAPGGKYSDMFYWNMREFQSAGGQVTAHDIWVGRITITDYTYGSEIELIRRALDANHYYRTGQSRLPHSAYVHVGDDFGGDAQAQVEVNVATQVWKNAYVDSNSDSKLSGVDGSDLICEDSHGGASSYSAGMRKSTMHLDVIQSRVMFCSSCSSGYPDGVVNNQLFTRKGGNIFSIGGSTTIGSSSYAIFNLWLSTRQPFLSVMAAGEIWGPAMLQQFPLFDRDWDSMASVTIVYGDLSMKPLTTPSNAMPVVTSLTADRMSVALGAPVTFSVAVTDPDGSGEKSLHVPFRHQFEWFMDGYDYGRNDPTYVTDDTQGSGWTSQAHAYNTLGVHTVRALVMDEWRAVDWKETTVAVTEAPMRAYDFFEGGTVGSAGWNTSWINKTNMTTTTGNAYEGDYSMYVKSAGTATRGVDMRGASNAIIRFQWKAVNFDAGETAKIEVYDGAWHDVFTVNDGDDVNAYQAAKIVLTPYAMVSNFQIRVSIQCNADDERLHLDSLRVLSDFGGNIAPTCALTAPANGATFAAPASIYLQATAADTGIGIGNTVAKVEFYNGATLLGEDTTSPYTCIWSDVPAGGYALTVRATDDDGAMTTSTVVNITVAADAVAGALSATGGTVTNYALNGTNYTAHIFTNSGTFVVTSAGTVEYLVVAGGGGGAGGAYENGGGGAGGMLTGTVSVTPDTYVVTIGAGGNGGLAANGGAGGNSFFGVTAIGGGRGTRGTDSINGGNGGSGGGAGEDSASYTGGVGVVGQGHNGARGQNADWGGGGGGAGGAPPAAASPTGGKGVTNSITGTPVVYARGGNGAGRDKLGSGANGAPNTGNGGGGAGNSSAISNRGGSGGSGIVIIRYVAGDLTCALSAPANGATFAAPASITLQANASSASGTIARVEFFHGTTNLGEDTTSPYAYTWTNVPEGVYTLTARATDNAGAMTTSAVVNVTVTAPNQPPVITEGPSVAVTMSEDNAPTAFSLTLHATDADGDALTWSISSQAAHGTASVSGTGASKSIAYTPAVDYNGSDTFVVQVSDGQGGVDTITVNLTIQAVNDAPTCALTAPANGATFVAPVSIALQVTAADVDGTIAKVEFFSGATLLGEDTTSPYAYTWSGVTAGSYTLTAKATDNSNAVATSAEADITVTPPPSGNALVTSVSFVGVPEGGTAAFRLKLATEPAADVTVTVARSGGDGDITVQSGASLTFTPGNWNIWQTVTLAAAEDGDTSKGSATLTCSAPYLTDVIVTATEIDNDIPPATDTDGDGLPDAVEVRLGRSTNVAEQASALPFVERFESDTVSPGYLHDQNKWVAVPTTGAVVQLDDVFEGSRAMRIDGGGNAVAVSQVLTGTPLKVVWLDLRQKVAGASVPNSVPTVAVVMLFNSDGRLVVCDGARPAGTEWVVLSNHTPRVTGTWTRLTARADYASQTWTLYLDGTAVAENLGFASLQTRPTCLSFEGDGAVLDDLYVGLAQPAGFPGAGNIVPDEWYLSYFGEIRADGADSDADGMSNLEEYLAGTHPDDDTSYLGFTELPVSGVPGEFLVRWQSVSGRWYTVEAATNLSSGFDSIIETNIPATPPENVHTDNTATVGQRFYRIKLE